MPRKRGIKKCDYRVGESPTEVKMEFRGTTICAVKRGGMTAVAGDGQVTMGESVIMKGNAVKVKRIYNDKVIIGFAGSVSDAFAL